MSILITVSASKFQGKWYLVFKLELNARWPVLNTYLVIKILYFQYDASGI